MLNVNDTITTAGGKDLKNLQRALEKEGYNFITDDRVITITGVPNEKDK